MIKKFSFFGRFFLSNTIIPKPAFTDNPTTIEPNDNAPDMKSWVSTTDDAQFGIKPTTNAISGWKIEDESKKDVKLSSPTKNIIISIIKFMAKINIKILSECKSGCLILNFRVVSTS